MEFLCKLDTNYGLSENCSVDISEYIHDNYDKMDINEQRAIVGKCLTDNQVRSMLLHHELKKFKEKPVENISLFDFTKKALDIFKRYQWKAGGFRYEDDTWTLYTSTSLEYSLKDNEVIFENTVDVADIYSDDVVEYNECILDRLNSLSKNIKVELDSEPGYKTTIVVTFRAKDTSQDVEDPIISL